MGTIENYVYAKLNVLFLSTRISVPGNQDRKIIRKWHTKSTSNDKWKTHISTEATYPCEVISKMTKFSHGSWRTALSRGVVTGLIRLPLCLLYLNVKGKSKVTWFGCRRLIRRRRSRSFVIGGIQQTAVLIQRRATLNVLIARTMPNRCHDNIYN